MGKRTDGLVEDEAAMVDDLLKLGGSLATLMRSQIGFATDKDRKHGGPFRFNGSRPPKLIRYGDPKTRNGGGGVSSVERKSSANPLSRSSVSDFARASSLAYANASAAKYCRSRPVDSFNAKVARRRASS